MSTPTRHDASDVAFLVSGMDRACGCPRQQGQQHDEDLDLDPDMVTNIDDWRAGSYTGLLMMEGGSYLSWLHRYMCCQEDLLLTYLAAVDMVLGPSDADMRPNQDPEAVDTLSVEVSFDVEDLSERDMDLVGQGAVAQ
jgi:hypothetical protein